MDEKYVLKTLKDLSESIKSSTKVVGLDYFREENDNLERMNDAHEEFTRSIAISDEKLFREFNI